MHYQTLIDRYLAGADIVRDALSGMTDDHMDAKPVPGKWSTRQVVCHIADFEPIYADRMKRVIAERIPTFFGGDPDTFAAGLAYDHRQVGEELELIAIVRRQMGPILRKLTAADFQRTGNHAAAGSMTLESLLLGVTDHIPHHVGFIKEKRRAIGI
jgi:uncharacterized damage-inducible protein DinB